MVEISGKKSFSGLAWMRGLILWRRRATLTFHPCNHVTSQTWWRSGRWYKGHILYFFGFLVEPHPFGLKLGLKMMQSVLFGIYTEPNWLRHIISNCARMMGLFWISFCTFWDPQDNLVDQIVVFQAEKCATKASQIVFFLSLFMPYKCCDFFWPQPYPVFAQIAL